MAANVYECGECGERTLERRCPDCQLFTRHVGTGGPCPSCDELILNAELDLNDQETAAALTQTT
jgi:hypothetical protein